MSERINQILQSFSQQEWHIKSSEIKDQKEIMQISAQESELISLQKTCQKCRKCGLYQSAQNLVFGEGNPHADIVFIGEAPGADEDKIGRPFVGLSGKYLSSVIKSCGLSRNDIYICNILKHRPPGNRDPKEMEIAACSPYLIEQLHIIQPELIVTLGNFATKFILNTKTGIMKMRGKIHVSPINQYKVYPTFHPAAITRNNQLKNDFEHDIKESFEWLKKTDK